MERKVVEEGDVVLGQRFLRESLIRHEFPPHIRSPGKINQWETLFFRRVWILDLAVMSQSPLLLSCILRKCMKAAKETEELRTMVFVEGPEKLLIVIADVSQMFFTRLQELALLTTND